MRSVRIRGTCFGLVRIAHDRPHWWGDGGGCARTALLFARRGSLFAEVPLQRDQHAGNARKFDGRQMPKPTADD